MSEYMFGPHPGHLTTKANQIAKRHGAWHINFTEPGGEKRGWFATRNSGFPFDRNVEMAVWADLEKAGGIESLTKRR